MRYDWVPALLLVALSSCAAQPPGGPQKQVAETAILAKSTPTDGSVVAGPVNQLQLRFARPARLLEVTIDGPDGLSPMMITAAGETTDYSVPLPGLGAGSYRVNWKASATGRTYNGMIAFTVRG